jgi:hypothetical protein
VSRDRGTLLADADYFAGELIRRLEGLQRVEPRTTWRTASALTRRVRLELRAARQRDADSQAREARLQESRR